MKYGWLVALLVAGCATKLPDAPTPVAITLPIAFSVSASPQSVVAPAPATITLTAMRGGIGIANVDLAWQTSSGELQTVSPHTDVFGHATAVLVSSATAIVSVDGAGAHTEVAVNVTQPPPQPPPAIPAPTPSPTPQPSLPPAQDPNALAVSVNCTAATSGLSADCVAIPIRGGTPLTTRDIAGATWLWGDGTSLYANVAASHQWSAAGSYPVAVNVFLYDGKEIDGLTFVTIKR